MRKQAVMALAASLETMERPARVRERVCARPSCGSAVRTSSDLAISRSASLLTAPRHRPALL